MPNELAQRIFGTPSAMALVVLAVLSAFLLAAAANDLQRRRIPNALVFPGALLAVLAHTLLPAGDGFLSALPGGLGLAGALKGLFLTLFALLPFYLLRAIGAGDVKLLAMTGAFLGPLEICWAVFFTVLAGGALAIAIALRRALLGSVLNDLRLTVWNLLLTIGCRSVALPSQATVGKLTLPYGVAIATGCMASMIYRGQVVGMY